MAGKIIIKDNGYAERLRAIKSLDGRVKSKAGVLGAAANEQHDSKSGLTVGALAAIHEFGLGVPERSFIRAWFDENKKPINDKLQEVAKEVVAGKIDVYQAMDEFGEWADQQIQVRVEAGIAPPLAEETIRRKGGETTPLIDTQKLLKAITHAVARES